MTLRVEITTSDTDFNDCYREMGALSAAEFYLDRLPEYMLPARIRDRESGHVIAVRHKGGDGATVIIGYHGVTRGEMVGQPRMPFYLAYTPDLAEAYAEGCEPFSVLKVTAAVRNPLKLDAPYRLREVLELTGALDKSLPNWHPAGTSRVTDWAASKGFDAILIPTEAGFGENAPDDAWEMACGTYGEPQMILLAPERVTVEPLRVKEKA